MNCVASALALALALTSIPLLSAGCGGKAAKAASGQPAAESESGAPFTLPEELVGHWVLFSDIGVTESPDALELNADGSGAVGDSIDFAWKVIDSRLVLLLSKDDLGNRDKKAYAYTIDGMRLTLTDEDGDGDLLVKKEYADAVKKGIAFMDACGWGNDNDADACDYAKAVAAFSNAVRLDPGFAKGYHFRGVAYYLKKDYDNAIADFSELIRLDPGSSSGYTYRGSAYSDKKDYDNAIADITKEIELEPDNATAYNNRGWAYCLKEEYDRGLEDIEKALELDVTAHQIYHSKGYAYSGKKEYDKAIAAFTESLRLERTDEAFTDRGKVYIETGDYAAAAADFESALEINPEYPGAAEGLEKAKELLLKKEKGKDGKAAPKKSK